MVNCMKIIKNIGLVILLLLLGTVEFILGFAVAIHKYLEDTTTDLQIIYDDVNKKAKPEGNTDK